MLDILSIDFTEPMVYLPTREMVYLNVAYEPPRPWGCPRVTCQFVFMTDRMKYDTIELDGEFRDDGLWFEDLATHLTVKILTAHEHI